MSMTDPISDFLSRIRNGALARKDRIEMPHSFLKKNIAEVLKNEGYVDDVRESEPGEGHRTLTLVLRYPHRHAECSKRRQQITHARVNLRRIVTRELSHEDQLRQPASHDHEKLGNEPKRERNDVRLEYLHEVG